MGMPIATSPMYRQPEGVNPEEALAGNSKVYLLLLQFDVPEEDGEFNQKWMLVTGRENAYKCIKKEIMDSFETNHPIVFSESFIAVDTVKIKITESKSIYRFMKDVIERGQIVDDSDFNIDDYYVEENPESNDKEEPRYGQGEQNIPYDQSTAVDGGEV